MEPVELWEGLATTRAIRRYRDEPVSDEDLAHILFGASRAPSGSNRQPFRFIVCRDGEIAQQAKELVAGAAQRMWAAKRQNDGYEQGSGIRPNTPKARMAATMDAYVDNYATVPVMIFAALVRYRAPNPYEGSSVYPACQNLLLAARSHGLGGVLTHWHSFVDAELRELLAIPEEVFLAATITLGHPQGSHGPVRRRPLQELVYEGRWGDNAPWAVDPPGTEYTSAGPPRAST